MRNFNALLLAFIGIKISHFPHFGIKSLTFLRDPECARTLHKSLKRCSAFSQSLIPFLKALLYQNAGLPNRSDFCGKGPDADLFALQGPENGPEITKKVRISG